MFALRQSLRQGHPTSWRSLQTQSLLARSFSYSALRANIAPRSNAIGSKDASTDLSSYSSDHAHTDSHSHAELATTLQIEPRLSLTFTCTVTACGTRSTHQFTKRSYTRGIVIVQCPGCQNRHLIADHLGWFKESTEEGTLKTVEDLMRAKGETVRRGLVTTDGVVEYTPE